MWASLATVRLWTNRPCGILAGTSRSRKDNACQDNPKGKGRKAKEKNVDAAGNSNVSFVRKNKTTKPEQTEPAFCICHALKDPLRGLAQGFPG